MRFAIVYRRAVCRCGSRMVTHLMVAPDVWRFGCASCKSEIDKSVIVEVEAEEWYVEEKE